MTACSNCTTINRIVNLLRPYDVSNRRFNTASSDYPEGISLFLDFYLQRGDCVPELSQR